MGAAIRAGRLFRDQDVQAHDVLARLWSRLARVGGAPAVQAAVVVLITVGAMFAVTTLRTKLGFAQRVAFLTTYVNRDFAASYAPDAHRWELRSAQDARSAVGASWLPSVDELAGAAKRSEPALTLELGSPIDGGDESRCVTC